MYFILSYSIIIIYLLFVLMKTAIFSTWFNNIFYNTKFLIIFDRIVYTTNICMSWGMFRVSPPLHYRIKIITETYDNNINVFYLEGPEIKKLISELRLSISCQSTIVNNYNQFSDFMNDFFTKKFKQIYNNIKYLQIHRLVYNSVLNPNCLNFDKEKSTMIYFHEYK
jgi:hypothetical protein